MNKKFLVFGSNGFIGKNFQKNNKLYTYDDKQIKVWHYCQGFGHLKEDEIEKALINWSDNFFNNETKEFFKSIGCKEYF